jgi:hypothetical protein
MKNSHTMLSPYELKPLSLNPAEKFPFPTSHISVQTSAMAMREDIYV